MENLTKEEALKKIKELEDYIKGCDKKVNVVTRYPDKDNNYLMINKVRVADIYESEEQGSAYDGFHVSRHMASMYLSDVFGTWYDKDGNIIKGYLYFKPE